MPPNGSFAPPVIQMDAPPSYGPLFRVIGAVILIFAVLLGGYFLWQRFLSGAGSNPLAGYFDLSYLTARADGTAVWYAYEEGKLVEHPLPTPGIVTGLARGGNAVFFVVETLRPSVSFVVYQYLDGVYTALNPGNASSIRAISASRDDMFVGVSGTGAQGRTVGVLDTRSGIITPLADGANPPQFLNRDGATAVLYTDGTKLMARVYAHDAWRAPVTVLTSKGATYSAIAADGAVEFAFRDPDQGYLQRWEVSSLEPFIASPLSSRKQEQALPFVYGGGALFTYQFRVASGTPVAYNDLRAINIESGAVYELRPPGSIDSSSSVFPLALPTPQ